MMEWMIGILGGMFLEVVMCCCVAVWIFAMCRGWLWVGWWGVGRPRVCSRLACAWFFGWGGGRRVVWLGVGCRSDGGGVVARSSGWVWAIPLIEGGGGGGPRAGGWGGAIPRTEGGGSAGRLVGVWRFQIGKENA